MSTEREALVRAVKTLVSLVVGALIGLALAVPIIKIIVSL